MGIEKSPSRHPNSAVDKQLADLYSRRLAVDSLIRSLESYAACQAKTQDQRPKPN